MCRADDDRFCSQTGKILAVTMQGSFMKNQVSLSSIKEE
jgi:hypothetical protein